MHMPCETAKLGSAINGYHYLGETNDLSSHMIHANALSIDWHVLRELAMTRTSRGSQLPNLGVYSPLRLG
jgi:hypothetical protein